LNLFEKIQPKSSNGINPGMRGIAIKETLFLIFVELLPTNLPLENTIPRWPKKNWYIQNFSIVNQSLQRQTLSSVSNSMRKIEFNLNSKTGTVLLANKKSNLCIHNLY
jgi:hypothetical protein